MPIAVRGQRRPAAAGLALDSADDRAPVPASGFEALAACSEQLACGPGEVFGALLAAAYPGAANADWSARPLWEEEAMHRAYRMLQLLLQLRAGRRGRTHGWHADHALASQLAADFRALSATAEHAPVPCSQVLRSIVRSFASLFGPAAGDIRLVTSIERVTLPAYRRRALVLAASELVLNAVSHAFHGCSQGTIAVRLQAISGNRACLRVEDDGIGYFDECADACESLPARLASLLDGRLVYRQGYPRATTAEIVFPVLRQAARRPLSRVSASVDSERADRH
jgi:hypothetical protein